MTNNCITLLLQLLPMINMMNCDKKISLVVLCFATFVYPNPIPSEEFPHYAILDSRNKNVLLYWKYDQETITFEVETTCY